MSETKTPQCFGFFLGDATCGQCAVQKQCKAILLSSGFDLVEATLDTVLDRLPEGNYSSTPEMSSLLDQIFFGPSDEGDVQTQAKKAFKPKVTLNA